MVAQDLMDQAQAEFIRVVPRVYRQVQSFRFQVAKELGISRAQMEVIALLSRKGRLSMTEVAQALVLAKSNITITVDQLVGLGCVAKQDHPSNRRIVLVELTSKGADFQGQFRNRFRKLVIDGLSGFNEEEIVVLVQGLQHLGAVVDRMTVTDQPLPPG